MSTKQTGTASGQAEAPLAQLKEVWKRLPEAAQDYWREQFSSSRKQSDLRTEILTKFKIKLSTDGKLTLFRAWLEANDQRLLMAEKIESRKQSDLRTEILTKFKIKLSTDGKLTLFRAWLEANDQRLLMAEKIESRKQ